VLLALPIQISRRHELFGCALVFCFLEIGSVQAVDLRKLVATEDAWLTWRKFNLSL